MKRINWHFERKALAKDYLEVVYQGAINRIALLDVRRTGKTSFLLKDFYPVALENGFVPVYVNLWIDPANPAMAIVNAIKSALEALDDTTTGKLKKLANANIRKVEVGNSVMGKIGVDFSDKDVAAVTSSDLVVINALIEEFATKCDDKAVLIIDEIQHLASSSLFDALQRSLRTALDTNSQINVVYSGSSRSGIDAMFSDKDKAFFNSAMMIDFPRLSDEFVQHCSTILKDNFSLDYNIEELIAFYNETDRSPYWMMQLSNYLLANKCPLEDALKFISELIVVDGDFVNISKSLTKSDKAVLQFVIDDKEQIFSADSMEELSVKAKTKMTASKIQTSMRKLKSKGIISQRGKQFYIELHGFVNYLEGEG